MNQQLPHGHARLANPTSDAHRLLDTEVGRGALAARDVSAVYRQLCDAGMSQRQLAELTGQSPSEVSEVVGGRRVHSYALLVRIADGLGVPRGWMGLAHSADATYPGTGAAPEVSEDVKRRALLAIASTVVLGAPVLGQVGPITVADVLTRPRDRIGRGDVTAYLATVTRLGLLDREHGGMAALASLVATAEAGETMLRAEHATDEVRRDLRYAIGEAHRLAGWSAGDVGLVDRCRWHMHRALDFVAGDPARVAGVLASTADMEKHHGAPNHALKLLQLADASTARDPQIEAVIAALSATAYLALDHPERATRALRSARELFPAGDGHHHGVPFFAFYGPGHGVLAAAAAKAGRHEQARSDVTAALAARPAGDLRCDALDTIVLARVLIEAGELKAGVRHAREAIGMAANLGSQRVRDRLEPLASALEARRDSTTTDLARSARQLMAPAGPGGDGS